MKLRIFNWRQGQNERFLETRKTKAMWYSTPAKIHSELNAFYPFYTLVLLIIKMIWEIQYCLFHEHHFVKTIWKYNCSTTMSTTSSALLARAVSKTFLSTQSEFFVTDIFRCSEALIFWCSNVRMLRWSGALIFWCLDVQRLRCWECDHVVQCSKVHKFICSEVECSSARCSKVQMFKGLQKVQQISAVTANVKHLRTLSDDAKCPQEHLASILNKARRVVMSKDHYDWCKLDETSNLAVLCKLGSTHKSGWQHFQDLMWHVVLWVTWYLGSGEGGAFISCFTSTLLWL